MADGGHTLDGTTTTSPAGSEIHTADKNYDDMELESSDEDMKQDGMLPAVVIPANPHSHSIAKMADDAESYEMATSDDLLILNDSAVEFEHGPRIDNEHSPLATTIDGSEPQNGTESERHPILTPRIGRVPPAQPQEANREPVMNPSRREPRCRRALRRRNHLITSGTLAADAPAADVPAADAQEAAAATLWPSGQATEEGTETDHIAAAIALDAATQIRARGLSRDLPHRRRDLEP